MNHKIIISEENIQSHFDKLSKIGTLGKTPAEGFLRAAWSKEESDAFEYVRKEAEMAGFVARYDAIGNLYLRIPGDLQQIVQVGSHLDTVPEGGNFDGTAGIIDGLESIKAICRYGLPIRKGLELVIWRGEEGATFDAPYKGSKAAFGELNPKYLKNEFNEKTLEQAILEQGFDPSWIRESRPTLTQNDINNIFAHIELHIEQGNKLENDGTDIGIITSIRGPARYRFEVIGEFDHSGATPMGSDHRKDANLASAYIQVELDKLVNKYLNKGGDLVQTIGILNADESFNNKDERVYNNALTKVSGFSYFTLDIRSNDKTFRDFYTTKVIETITKVAESKGVSIEIEHIASEDPVEKLDDRIQESIKSACEELNYSFQYIPSGAGHDAAVVAKQKRSNETYTPVGMIFIPCKGGKSHCKEEFVTTGAVTKGANVLAQTLYQLAK